MTDACVRPCTHSADILYPPRWSRKKPTASFIKNIHWKGILCTTTLLCVYSISLLAKMDSYVATSSKCQQQGWRSLSQVQLRKVLFLFFGNTWSDLKGNRGRVHNTLLNQPEMRMCYMWIQQGISAIVLQRVKFVASSQWVGHVAKQLVNNPLWILLKLYSHELFCICYIRCRFRK